MLSLQRTLSPRYLGRRWGRALLVVLSIGLGVGMLTATRCLNQSMTRAARSAVTPLAGGGDLLVTNGDQGVPRDLVRELRQAPIAGLRDVHPLILARVALPQWQNRSALLIGIELEGAEAPTAGKWGVEVQASPRPLLRLPLGFPVYVGSQLAADLPADAWDFQVRAGGRTRTVSRLGTVTAHGPAAALGGSVLFLRLTDAGRVVGRPDFVTRIDLSLEPGASREQVRQRVADLVDGRAEVRTLEASDAQVNDVMAGVELAFSLGGVCALVVGLFLVYNALAVSVAERRHDIGILRALGATRGQVAGLFAFEACVLGLLGSLVGVPLGWGLAWLGLGPLHLQRTVGDLFVPLETGALPPLDGTTILLAFGAGMATALLAALVPALQAAREEPADAVRRTPPLLGFLARLLHAGVCLLLVAAGLTAIALRNHLTARTGAYAGIILVLLGALAATPLVTALAARLLQPLARYALGIAERLAADNLARSPGRSGLVIGALAAGVALLIQTAGIMASSERALLGWIDRVVLADLIVSSFNPVTSTQNQPMDESVAGLLRSLPEVERVVPIRFQYVSFRDKIINLLALDSAALADPDARLAQVPDLDLFLRLREPGTAVVSENFAAQYGVHTGEDINLRGPRGPVTLRVIGTREDYGWARGSILMDRDQYKRLFDDNLVDAFDVYLRAEAMPARAAVRETISRRWAAQEGLVVLTREELREKVRETIRGVHSVGYAQEVVVVIVAALGVVTALLISVLQQRRQIGLLRAVGASRFQVLRSVLAEAVLMGATGAGIGLLFGVPLEWYALQVILLDEAGFTFPVVVPWVEAGVVVGGTLLLALLAGLLPAVRAVQLPIADAIAYE